MDPTRIPQMVSSSNQHFASPLASLLPAELWLHIFEIAVLGPFSHSEVSHIYHPFSARALRERDWVCAAEAQQSLDIKRTLVLVCRAWRRLAERLMYRHIRACRKMESLRLGLGITDEEGVAPPVRASDDYTRWVRSLEITGRHNLDYDPSNPTTLLPLLTRCSSTLERLIRPTYPLPTKSSLSAIQLPPGAKFPTFTSLRRVDWWLPIQTRTAVPFHDLLGQILTNAPRLEYLTLGGGERTFGYASGTANAPAQPAVSTSATAIAHAAAQAVPPSSAEPSVSIYLSSLQTLRLECKSRSALITPTWVLPSLRHVILGADYFAALPILSTHGHLLATLEILNCPTSSGCIRAPFGGGILRDLLEFCPKLEELAFNTDQSMSLLGDQKHFAHPTLKTVRLNLGNLQPLNPNLPLGVLLEKCTLEKLEQVVLYGNWDGILAGKPFEHIHMLMDKRGVKLVFHDGRYP